MRLTYRNKLHGVDDPLLEGSSVCVQHQRDHHDEEDNVRLDIHTKSWPQVHHRHQDQVAQQQTAFPPVVLVPTCAYLFSDRYPAQGEKLHQIETGQLKLLSICRAAAASCMMHTWGMS